MQFLDRPFFQNGIFAVDPNTTPDQLEARRQRVAQMFANPQSNSVAEGLVKLAGGAVAGIQGRNANRFEAEKRSEATDLFNQVLSQRGGQSTPTLSAPPQPAPPTSQGISPPSPISTGPIPDTPGAVAADTRQSLGLPPSLVKTESGGNFNALNNEVGAGGVRGHGGRGQFGHARLQDAAAAGLVPPGTTPKQFSQMPPETQIAVENWHIGEIDRAIDNSAAGAAIGSQINGVTVTRNGLRAVAHLGGVGGMQRFVESGGRYNPSDSFGTSLTDYLGTHGQAEQQAGGFPAPQPADTSALQIALANPWMTAEQRALLTNTLQQRERDSDPLRQLQIQQAQLNLDQARNPQPETTDDIREYNFARQQGYQGTFQEFMNEGRAAGATQVNVGQGEVGTIPQGFELFTDPNSGARSLRPIPGGPAALEQEQTERARENAAAQSQQYGSIVFEDIGRVKDMLNGGRGQPVTGAAGALAANVPGSEAADARALVETIRANIGFDRLQAMREASPTGGALGNVTERELATLQAVMGSLEFSQSKEQLLQNLTRLEDIYSDIIDKAARTGDGTLVSPNQSSAPNGDGWVEIDGVRIREVQ